MVMPFHCVGSCYHLCSNQNNIIQHANILSTNLSRTEMFDLSGGTILGVFIDAKGQHMSVVLKSRHLFLFMYV